MITAIKSFFRTHIDTRESQTGNDEALKLAATALLLETARADFEIEGDELKTIADSVQAYFQLSHQDTQELLALAEQEAESTTSYYEFTSLINQSFSAKQKSDLIELMWRVAYADQNLQKYEEAMIRKVAELLYVPHSEFIRTKHKVLQAL